MAAFTIEELAEIVARRASADDPQSYTASLARKGVQHCAKKLGEEAVETALAAVGGDRAHLVAEAADLIYHLLVLLQVSGVTLDEVSAELGRRTGQTGLQEKASRPRS